MSILPHAHGAQILLRSGARRYPAVVGSLLPFVLTGLLSCATPTEERPVTADLASGPSSVLLITIDTLRADRLVAEGPMPRLWALAGRGYRFTTVHTPVPLTLPAHSTILTGLGPQHHGVRDNIGYALQTDLPTVAEALSAAGWTTAAFVGGYPLSRAFGLARGFGVYDDRMTRTPEDGRQGHTERRADEVVDSALEWLSGQSDGPFFLWVHLFDPHDPYEAPPPFRGRHADPYDDEVEYTDTALGRLVDAVLAHEPGPPWILVTADHGEALGDHGESTHGIFLYESTLRVPLVIVPPGEEPVSRVLDHPVTLADLAPTMLEAAGLPEPLPVDGRSLLPILLEREAGRSRETSPLYLESIHGRQRYGWSPLAGFVDWPEKFVSAPRPELYDLHRDPQEGENRFTPEQAKALGRRLEDIRDVSDADDLAAEPGAGVDLERLASLGYVGASGVAKPEDALYDRPRPDPKDRIAAVPQIDLGLAAMVAGRDAEAQRAFEAALGLDPDNLVALNDLGLLAMRSGEVSRAESYFREGLRRDKNAEATANNLGLALGRLNRYVEAEEAFRQALAVRPGFTLARFNLAVVLQRQWKSREALKELERVESEEPEFPGL
jgi:arylsulfatase A-like enzyme